MEVADFENEETSLQRTFLQHKDAGPKEIDAYAVKKENKESAFFFDFLNEDISEQVTTRFIEFNGLIFNMDGDITQPHGSHANLNRNKTLIDYLKILKQHRFLEN